MQVSLRRVVLPDDHDAVNELLVGNAWPYHGASTLTAEMAGGIVVASDTVESWWIDVDGDGDPAGIVRVFDLDDLDDGSPLFDLRITERARGRGIGTAALGLLTDDLFRRFPHLHRIEATTRDDNDAMQRVLERCGYRREGCLRESWRRPDGTRADTLVYGILRSDPRPG